MRYLTSTIITLSVLVSGLTLALPAFAQATCPKGTTYADGCSDAPAGTPQYPSIMSGYAVRSPWNVAGVDYYVGYPSGITLKNPSTISTPGVSLSGHEVDVNGSNVVLDGYNFNGWNISVGSGATNLTVRNSNFFAA